MHGRPRDIDFVNSGNFLLSFFFLFILFTSSGDLLTHIESTVSYSLFFYMLPVAEAGAPRLWSPHANSQSTHWKRPWCCKDWRQKEKGWQRMRWLNSSTDSINMNMSKIQEMVEDRGAWCVTVHGVAKTLKWLNNNSGISCSSPKFPF